MIFDLAFKQVRCLFKPRHLFPIVRLEWQVLVPVFTSLIVWLEANTFIKVHGLHSLTKHVCKVHPAEDNKRDKYTVNDGL